MKLPAERGVGHYHCFSRVVDRRKIMGIEEKERFVSLMRELEQFCEVQVLTYCVMANHFHILVEVKPPPPMDARPTMEAIIDKLSQLTGHQSVGTLRQLLASLRNQGDEQGEQELLALYHARLWDVSAFMKLLKQRFTQWYNARKGRTGTLWEDRFKSVLVEGSGTTVAAMAAYIDLNPLRAGLEEEPGQYRWSGYGEALAGRKQARAGIKRVAQALKGGKPMEWNEAIALYRMSLFRSGDERREGLNEEGKPIRGTLKAAAVENVVARKGRVPIKEYVRRRVRYFCDGAAIGGRTFVEEMFQTFRPRFGPKRKNGARRMRGVNEKLYVLRDLQTNLFG